MSGMQELIRDTKGHSGTRRGQERTEHGLTGLGRTTLRSLLSRLSRSVPNVPAVPRRAGSVEPARLYVTS